MKGRIRNLVWAFVGFFMMVFCIVFSGQTNKVLAVLGFSIGMMAVIVNIAVYLGYIKIGGKK